MTFDLSDRKTETRAPICFLARLHIFKYLSSAVCLLSQNKNFLSRFSVHWHSFSFINFSRSLAPWRPTRRKERTQFSFLLSPPLAPLLSYQSINISLLLWHWKLESHHDNNTLNLFRSAFHSDFLFWCWLIITSWSSPTTFQSHFLSVQL